METNAHNFVKNNRHLLEEDVKGALEAINTGRLFMLADKWGLLEDPNFKEQLYNEIIKAIKQEVEE